MHSLKESAVDRWRLLKARGLALTHLATFEPFGSYFLKNSAVYLSAEPDLKPSDCSTEKWAEISHLVVH